MGMVWCQRFLIYFQGPLIKWFRLRIMAPEIVNLSQVVNRDRHIRMVIPQGLISYGQRFLLYEKKGYENSRNPLFYLVPKGGFEPPRTQGPLRPERSVYTNFTTSANPDWDLMPKYAGTWR